MNNSYNYFGHPGTIINLDENPGIVVKIYYKDGHTEEYGFHPGITADELTVGIAVENSIPLHYLVERILDIVEKVELMRVDGSEIKTFMPVLKNNDIKWIEVK